MAGDKSEHDTKHSLIRVFTQLKQHFTISRIENVLKIEPNNNGELITAPNYK